MRFLKYTEQGASHAKNEDFAIYSQHASGSNRFVGFIADGQGGREDGDLASRLACEHAHEFIQSKPWNRVGSSKFWDQLLESIDLSVRENCNGFTTFIGFAIDQHELTGTSVGDSKLYHFNGDQVSELTQAQQKNPPIGGGCKFGRHFLVSKPAGQFLAATDGVWKYCGYDSIVKSLQSPIEQALDILLTKCRLETGKLQDDFTYLTWTANSQP